MTRKENGPRLNVLFPRLLEADNSKWDEGKGTEAGRVFHLKWFTSTKQTNQWSKWCKCSMHNPTLDLWQLSDLKHLPEFKLTSLIHFCWMWKQTRLLHANQHHCWQHSWMKPWIEDEGRSSARLQKFNQQLKLPCTEKPTVRRHDKSHIS